MAGMFITEGFQTESVLGLGQRKLIIKRFLAIGKQIPLREKLIGKGFKPYWKEKLDFIKQNCSPILIQNMGLKPKKIF